jgi:hypothetical protein
MDLTRKQEPKRADVTGLDVKWRLVAARLHSISVFCPGRAGNVERVGGVRLYDRKSASRNTRSSSGSGSAASSPDR